MEREQFSPAAKSSRVPLHQNRPRKRVAPHVCSPPVAFAVNPKQDFSWPVHMIAIYTVFELVFFPLPFSLLDRH